MPQPTSALSSQRPDLASFAEFDLEMQNRGYIASRVLPVIDTAKQSGTFGVCGICTQLRTDGDGQFRQTLTFVGNTSQAFLVNDLVE